MFTKTTLLALAAASAAQAAAPQGFNYGSMLGGKPVDYNGFKSDFEKAQSLPGAPGTFNAARLYTMLSGNNDGNLIPALQAAIDTKTYLLLGLWASGADTGFDSELAALNKAVSSMPDLGQYILGISVGSEDLYRNSPVGQAKPGANPGQEPDKLVNYIKKVRDAISKSSAWSSVKVGHVDTWTAWVNGSNSAVIENSDFLGVDAYPYWQDTEDNRVENGKAVFDEAMDNTRGVANGKPLWITETGWPVTGAQSGKAEANTQSAQTFWQEVGCPNFGDTPTFWYTMYDGLENAPDKKETPSFSIADANRTPLFDLSCSNVSKDNNSTSSSSSSSNSTSSTGSSSNGSSSSGTSTGTAAKSTGTGSASSGSSNGTYTGSPNTPSGTSGSGSGSSSSGTGASGSGTSSGSGSTGSGAPATGSAATLSISLGSMAALAAGVVALL